MSDIFFFIKKDIRSTQQIQAHSLYFERLVTIAIGLINNFKSCAISMKKSV